MVEARQSTPLDEWDVLVGALERRGIRHLAPGRPVSAQETPRDAEALFLRLGQSQEVRLNEAIIPLLLTHPHLAEAAHRAFARLSGAARDKALRRYVAAAALQRMWKTRLSLALGPRPLLPPAYLEELGLPPLEQDDGRATLWELARQEERRYGYDAWAGYTSLADLVLAEMARRGWGHERA